MELITLDKRKAFRAVITTYNDITGGDVPIGASREELNDYFANDIFISIAAAATNDEITEDEFKAEIIEYFAAK